MRDDRHQRFQGLCDLLPPAARNYLDEILSDAMARGLVFDQLAITREIFKANIVRLEPLPPQYEVVAKASGGRWYELTFDGVNPCDERAMRNLRKQYLRECERVIQLAKGDVSLEAAWARIRADDRISQPKGIGS